MQLSRYNNIATELAASQVFLRRNTCTFARPITRIQNAWLILDNGRATDLHCIEFRNFAYRASSLKGSRGGLYLNRIVRREQNGHGRRQEEATTGARSARRPPQVVA